jgi:ADP-ribose pyrophosphatase
MKNPFRRTSRREVHKGRLIRLWVDDVLQPRGTPAEFEVAEIKHGSSVLALDDRRNVTLVREWKYAFEHPSLEVVSGGIEPDEQPLDAAQRELREEAGLIARQWVPLGVVDPFTTMVRCRNHLFIARDLEDVAHEREEGEVMEVHRLPIEAAFEMVMQGEITHAASCVLVLKTFEWLRTNS